MKILFREATQEENQLLQDAITDITVIKGFPRAKSKKIDLMAWTSDGELIGGINSEWVNWGILFIHLLFLSTLGLVVNVIILWNTIYYRCHIESAKTRGI